VYRKTLPRYNTALGPAQQTLVVAPPFTYPGVTARIFPLRANLNLLRAFCDSYLNVAPEVCEFLPYLPYVLLVVLDYGRMSLDELNLGWVSQHEVLFEVPLGMWRRDRLGRRIFSGWVVNTPFIVVDNAASLTTGREAYGWPKVLAELQDSPERWLIDPRNPTRFLTLDVKGLDSDAPNVRLLEIDQQSGQNPSLVPMDLEVIDPFGRLSRLTRTSMSMGRDLAQLLLGAPLAGFDSRRSGDRRAVLFDSLRQLSGFYGEPGVNVVTLKQFRDFEDPTLICYQALVKSRLEVARYNRGGFLGLNNLLRGDITGGFQIRLHDNPAFPIVASLGLQVEQERTVRGHAVSFLEPVFPFWMSVDLTYGAGETLCWRTRDYSWQVKGRPARRVSHQAEPRFNTIAGGAEQVWRGPYFIPEASFNVYPLKARSSRLKLFLEEYLNEDGELRFDLDREEKDEDGKGSCSYVYMVASANRIFSKARSNACIQSSQITFYVPLVLKPKLDGKKPECEKPEVEKSVLAIPFAFVDSPVLATTMREVQGVPAMNATIESPLRFLQNKGPLLRMQVYVFEALDAGLRSEAQTLLEIVPGDDNPAEPERLLNFGTERLMLKQFRDAVQPDRACYQSLVFEPWTVSARPGPRTVSLGREMKIHVYRYPSLPLVDTLGLVSEGEPLEMPGGAIVDVLAADGPYKVDMSVEIELGREIPRTADLTQWRITWSDLNLRARSRRVS
jgi:hypothetical protein